MTWYTWLEQACDVRASEAVLDALADVLGLDSAEHAYLRRLGRGGNDAATALAPSGQVEHVTPRVCRLINNLGQNPAYILGRHYDVLAHNPAAAAVFGYDQVPAHHRNIVRLLFTDPAHRALFDDWEAIARRVLVGLRSAYGAHTGDPAFTALVAELHHASPEFRAWWPLHEVAARAEGVKHVQYPRLGRLVFEHAMFTVTDAPHQQLALYSPLAGTDTATRLTAELQALNGLPVAPDEAGNQPTDAHLPDAARQSLTKPLTSRLLPSAPAVIAE